ncbi:hypothetical protein HME9302_01646 [Alteripontixanthobacter maritimus]|uniref:DUF3089 domain-containing protein n=1 Tax=Alteripontixanthobacter maritimus TaxID=2161824 RepID=A0A369QBZ7_9SPHN|nr:DUF3089 domain-containing protein [Alteripontixanthobacter maritimus]RDC60439.1 hypothetical protein HME9302_01646 [Alteripontixanthobacter maritimus]
MARKFLYVVAFLIVLVIAGLFVLRTWSSELTEIALTPTVEFTPQDALANDAYRDPAMWYARPGMGAKSAARWQPAYAGGEPAERSVREDAPPFAVFFVHPTSYVNRAAWNAPEGDAEAERIAKIQIRGLASAFNPASEIWAPKYRQATVGAFLAESPEATAALDAAFQDVQAAFETFLAAVDEDTPIVLVGHSQGSAHLVRLLAQDLADTPVMDRIAAVYAVGWPISVSGDLPALGLPACATPAQSGCLLSWSSYAEPADPQYMLDKYAVSAGLDGQPRGNGPILCTNPLTGTINAAAPASENKGTLVPEADFSTGELVRGAVPARCDERGVLLIGDPPELGPAVLPGNNYHVYDIPLFWANLQADVVRRVESWGAAPR